MIIVTQWSVWFECVDCHRVHTIESECLPVPVQHDAISFPCYEWHRNFYLSMHGCTQEELAYADKLRIIRNSDH